MYRTIWSYYFITGLLSLTAGVPAMDDWASALIPQVSDATCRISSVSALFSRAEVTVCLAAGFNGARAMSGAGFDVLFNAHHAMPLAGWIQLADVLMIMIGVLAAAIALIWVWANGMTRLAALSMTGTYTLFRAIGMALERRGYHA